MKFQLTKKLGSAQVTISGEADAQMELFKAASFFSEIPDVCGNGSCRSTDMRFLYRQPKGYEYASILCRVCGHELTFGVYKENKGLFAKEWRKYVPGQHEEEPKKK